MLGHSILRAFSFVFFTENLKIVNLQGKLKSNKKLASELSFDFGIGSVGKFADRTEVNKALCETSKHHL